MDSYCKSCGGCGQEDCCSPLKCTMGENCDYAETYLSDLKFGYHMNEWVQTNLLDTNKIPQGLIDLYNEEWEKAYDKFYIST